MDVIYIANVAPRKWFTSLVEKKHRFSIPAYKFNDLIIKGLRKNGARVHVPVDISIWSLVTDGEQANVYEEDGVFYYLMPEFTGIRQKIKTIRRWMIDKIQECEKAYVLCDALNMLSAWIAVCCARKTKTKAVGIFTDLPVFLRTSKVTLKGKVIDAGRWWTFKRYDGYILLTEEMKNKVGRGQKPYMVMEGLVDADYSITKKAHKEEKNILIYAGAIHKIYGIETLIEGFIKADLQNAELHIYGSGDYEEMLREICKKEPHIKWFGVVPNEIVTEAEQKATLLINPRPTNEEFTKYSFPSKNMEYMLSGTAVLTTKLPGMPKEYHPYVFLVEDESVDGWAKTLQTLLSMDRSVLKEKGRQAQQFVQNQKNNYVQAKRMLSFMESL